MMYAITNTAALAVTAGVLLYLILVSLTVPRPIPGVPHKRGWRWAPGGHLASLGFYWFFSGESFSWFSRECLDLRSPVAQVFLPSFSWTRPTLILADLAEIEDVAMRRLGEMDRASLIHDLLDFVMPRATFSMATDEKLKAQRRLWSVLLSPGFLREVAAPRFHESISRLIELWELKSASNGGVPFEATEDLRFTALDAIWGTAMNSNLGMVQREIQKINPYHHSVSEPIFQGAEKFVHSVENLLWTLNWTMTSIYPRLSQWLIGHLSFFKNSQRAVDDVFYSEIDNTRADLALARNQGLSGLSEVLKRHANLLSAGQASVNDIDALKDELLQFLVFGHETTSAAVGWALKHLADNQDIQARLRAALRLAFPATTDGKIPGVADIVAADVPYLEAFVSEVLRVSYVGPVAFRETLSDCDLMGYRIPAGTTILLVTGGPSHLVEDIYPQPNSGRGHSSGTNKRYWDTGVASLQQFAPERWLRVDGNYDAIAGPSLPFSTGARGCFGRKIALMELKFMVAMLVLSFEFPRLEFHLSGYGSTDAQIRRPTSCYVQPIHPAR
ncbi:cytochrome P450 monooxygenase [Colletotrichum sojae]|uniref:Cytochrome P450 monooxygenase n=1 Tax=Colletotrichum sojae TaxID=2175907 RepID=A0A8H6JG12_9PEZI|nr:cytochrome P450 monooxygenase [Colletotrichum sojae]